MPSALREDGDMAAKMLSLRAASRLLRWTLPATRRDDGLHPEPPKEEERVNRNDVIDMAAQSVIEAYENAQESMSEADCIEVLERVIADFQSRIESLDPEAP
jgi:hypothetical protein